MKYTEYTDEQIQEIKQPAGPAASGSRSRSSSLSSACCLRWWGPGPGGAIYLVLGIACLLMGVLLVVDHIRREREEKAKKQDAADADKE